MDESNQFEDKRESANTTPSTSGGRQEPLNEIIFPDSIIFIALLKETIF